MKCYLDEDVSPRVAEIARGKCGIDVVSAHDVGTVGWSDPAQLRYAAQDGRCLVTRNRDDFIALTVMAFEAQTPHAGVLVVPHTIPSDHFTAIAHALCHYVQQHPDGVQSYVIDYLSAG